MELDNTRLPAFQHWDIPYYSEKLRQHHYAISQEELRPYFPAPRVVQGLFAVVRRLYGLRIERWTGVETFGIPRWSSMPSMMWLIASAAYFILNGIIHGISRPRTPD
jgi:Zn-dependent oligopeptidase